MKKLLFLFMLFTSNVNAQTNVISFDTLPVPEVSFKNWNKSFVPPGILERGSELVATCKNGVPCKVISYTFSTTIQGFVKDENVRSNKFNGKVLDLFNQLPIDSKFYIQDIVIQYSNGALRNFRTLFFKKVKDEYVQFVKSTLSDNPVIEDFGVFKSNIRIKVEGNAKIDDIKIVNELVNEIKPLFHSISIKIVDKCPNFILDIRNDPGDGWGGIDKATDTIPNPLFPKVNQKHVKVKMSSNVDLKWRKILLTHAVIENLANFHISGPWNDWDETFLHGGSCSDCSSKLTTSDKRLIEMLYSSEGQSELKNILIVSPVRIADETLLVLILSFFIFLSFSELNSKFHFLRIFEFAKSILITKLIYSILIIQIPIIILLILNYLHLTSSFKLFYSYELYFSILSCLAAVFVFIIDIVYDKLKIIGLQLLLDLIFIPLSFLICYQIVYMLIDHEILKFSILEVQWLFIPLTIVAYRFYLNYSQKRMLSILREKELELVKQKGIALKSELLALQSRINPHFLYNALNSIASLVHIDTERTEKMTLALARLFRYNLNKGDETFSTIEKEIDIVKIYLDVEMVRFSDRLKYSIDVEKDLSNNLIPVFLLQPLVENAIKHGISKLTENGMIQIKIYAEDPWLVISVFDNGPSFPSDITTNYGLQSVFDKLSLLYKENYEAKFINSPEKNIQIKIKR